MFVSWISTAGKLMVDFLLVINELLSVALMAEALRVKTYQNPVFQSGFITLIKV